MLAAKLASRVPAASSSTPARLSRPLWRNSRFSRFATAMPSASPGTWASRLEVNVCPASGRVPVSAVSGLAWRSPGLPGETLLSVNDCSRTAPPAPTQGRLGCLGMVAGFGRNHRLECVGLRTRRLGSIFG